MKKMARIRRIGLGASSSPTQQNTLQTRLRRSESAIERPPFRKSLGASPLRSKIRHQRAREASSISCRGRPLPTFHDVQRLGCPVRSQLDGGKADLRSRNVAACSHGCPRRPRRRTRRGKPFQRGNARSAFRFALPVRDTNDRRHLAGAHIGWRVRPDKNDVIVTEHQMHLSPSVGVVAMGQSSPSALNLNERRFRGAALCSATANMGSTADIGKVACMRVHCFPSIAEGGKTFMLEIRCNGLQQTLSARHDEDCRP